MTLAQGTLLSAQEAFPIVARAATEPHLALTGTVAAFLRDAVFMRPGGLDADTPFKLKAVQESWPDPSVKLEYPSASIVDAGEPEYEAAHFTPKPLRETRDVYGCGTVLWKTAELVGELQVDFWANDEETRGAMGSRLQSLFSPGEQIEGVILQGDPEYYDRPVRATLMAPQRPDTENTVFSRERRLMVRLRCEMDVVHLRGAVDMLPKVLVTSTLAGDL